MEKTKIMKTAKIVDRIMKILQGFAIAGMIVAAVLAVCTAFLGDKMIADASVLKLGPAKLTLAGDMAEYLDRPWAIVSVFADLAALFTVSLAAWFIMRALRGILAPMKEGGVFAEGASKNVRKLALAVLIGGGAAEFVSRIAYVIEFKAYNADVIFNRAIVSAVDAGSRLSPWFLITAGILFFLSYVFRCGEKLQKESDETL